ncbi:MAG: ABC transporter permease [Acidobacteriia bacterium]|nr:ABC transporter permease [Terriglobia bacterium]
MRLWPWLKRRSRENSELDEEIRFHLLQEAQLRIDRGEPPDAARRSALRDFGNVTLAAELTRQMWGWSALERAAQDLRFAARMMRRSPAFTAVALAALALGIGATTAMFSVVNAVLLRPLPFPDAGRLVMVWERPPEGGLTNVVQTQNFFDWRKRNRSFENIAALFRLPANLESEGDPVQVPGLRVTAGFFEILGTPPLLGRTIRPEDDVTGGPGVVVLSHGLWQRRFGSRQETIGRKMIVDGSAREVIGVMPPGFAFPAIPRVDLYLPMQIHPSEALLDGRNYSTVARLRRNTSLADAAADMRAVAAQTARERPDMNAKWSATVVPLLEQTVGDTRTTLLVLLGAVAFVLLIACANVSNLLLMRANARRREIAVRAALGAGRWRLFHQLAMESLLLALAGGFAGFLLAWWGVPAVRTLLPATFPRAGEIEVDRGVLAFTLLVSVACGLFFGIFPALQVDRGRLGEGLRAGGRYGSAAHRSLRNLLVVTEVSLAVLLVVGAGLMLRSFVLLHEVDPGFRPERLLTLRMMLFPQASSFAQLLERRAALVAGMLERIRALPQVESAASIHMLPLTGLQSGTWYYRADRPAPPPGDMSGGDVSVVSDDYFRTMGIPLLAGREFDLRDRRGSPHVALLNQAAARANFPGENPIGKRVKVTWSMGPEEVEIVGLAADIRHNALDATPEPCLFLPHAQQPSGFVSLVVRTRAQSLSAVSAVKEQIRAAAPHQGAQEIETMEDVVSASIARPRLDVAILGVFGLLALALAALGIYAVVSYSVEQRTREMGIRLALGAAPRSIRRMVLREGLLLALAGIGAGLAAALGLTRYLASLLYAIRPTDALVYAAVSAVLAAAIAGCFVPARRATRVDPAVVLREE